MCTFLNAELLKKMNNETYLGKTSIIDDFHLKTLPLQFQKHLTTSI